MSDGRIAVGTQIVRPARVTVVRKIIINGIGIVTTVKYSYIPPIRTDNAIPAVVYGVTVLYLIDFRLGNYGSVRLVLREYEVHGDRTTSS